MDRSRVDWVARLAGAQRTRRSAAAALAGVLAAPLVTGPSADAKKKKKPCRKKCKDGCCTSKFGKCIQPAQQSPTQCGSGGAICQQVGCPVCTPGIPCPTGQCCSGTGTCGSCLAFVTSSVQNGNLGALTGADAICQARATAAGLPGIYLAWLSNGTDSPDSRFTRATTSYTLVDGTVIADNFTDLTSGSLNAALNKTETGQALPAGNFAWTNTLTTGLSKGADDNADCGNWTAAATNGGNIGTPDSASSNWTELSGGIVSGCDGLHRLYCFQQR